MNKKGVTIVELIIVIVIMGVISTFAVIGVTRYFTNSKILGDTNTVVVLNKVTADYAYLNGLQSSQVFANLTTDEERLNELIDDGFLEEYPEPNQDGASFIWSDSEMIWVLEGGETIGFTGSSLSFDFSSQNISDLVDDGVIFIDETRWNDEGDYLENDPGEQRMFVPVGKTTYTVNVTAALTAGTNGGYGIYFDTILPGGNERADEGWILQFDRGYARGSMIVRPRSNGRESGAVWSLQGRNTDLFPSIDQDASWWTDTHSIKIVVSKNEGDSKTATFFIDGAEIGSYTYTFADPEETIYSGFRTWAPPTTEFYSISVN